MVEVWDLTPLSHPEIWADFKASGQEGHPFAGYLPVGCSAELPAATGRVGAGTYFVDFAGNGRWSYRAKELLARAGARRLVGELGSIPPIPAPPPRSPWLRLAQVLSTRPAALLNKAVVKWNSIRLPRSIPPAFVMVSGQKSLEAAAAAGYGDRVIRAHNFDYDRYLSLRDARDPSDDPYIVFLDQDVCAHPEFIFENLTPYATPGRYIPTIAAGLRAIASALGTGIRVAAHPRSAHRAGGHGFPDDVVVEFNRTAELIRGCAAVVGHSSTALQFAVLFRKPIIFTMTAELEHSEIGPYTAKFAELLGKRVVDLDAPDVSVVDWRGELTIDAPRYASYRNDYVKTAGSEEAPLWDIVISHLERRGTA